MTYKNSNWTRGELGNVPDENPLVPCGECGESFKWRDYWKERLDRMDNPREETWRCDECHTEREQLKRREENNQTLTRFVE